MDNNYQAENPFEPRQYDFYDEIVTRDSRRATSRCMLGLFLVNVISYAIVFGVQFILLFALGEERAIEILDNVYFSTLLGSLPIYTFGLSALYLVIRRLPRKRFARTGMRFIEFLSLIPISQVLMTLGNIVGISFNAVFEAIKGSDVTNSTTELLSKTPVWLTVILAVIIGPIVEEFIFRKLLMDRLAIYGNVFAIVITSVAFGLFHGNFYQFFYATLLGFVLGYVAVKSGNWLWSVLLHMIMNFIGGIIPTILEYSINLEKVLEFEELLINDPTADISMYLDYLPDMLIYSIYNMIMNMLFIGGAVLLVLAIVKRKRWIKVKNHCTVKIPRGRVGKVVFANVGTILFLVSSALIMVMSILV